MQNIKIMMKKVPPIKVSDISRDHFRIYEPLKLDMLCTDALLRKGDVGSVNDYYSQPQVPPQQRTMPQQQVPSRPTPAPPPPRTMPQQQVPSRPTPAPPPPRTMPQQQVPPRPTPAPLPPRTMPQPQVPQRTAPAPQPQRPVPQQAPVRKPPRPALPPAQRLLKKGEKYSLSKNHSDISHFRVGIGWDMATPVEYDVDIEAFLLNDSEKVPDDSWIVFYGQLQSPDDSVIHRGDSSGGTNFGPDCEQIEVNLKKLNMDITKIAFVITINEAKQRGYNFSGLKNAYIRFIDVKTGKEFIRYQLTDYYREVVSMVVGELYFRNGEWRFNPVGMGTGDDLEGLCNRYGIEVND